MKFTIFIKANKDTEAGVMPSQELLTAMGKYNEELVKAGIMKDGDGMKPSSAAVRVHFDSDKRTVTKGPFPMNEVICGYWIWECKSLDEAIEWVKRCPNPTGAESHIEVRPHFSPEDFGAEFTPELRKQEEALRAKIEAKK